MTADELLSWRRMSGLPTSEFASRLNVSPDEYVQMETGQEEIPARFDDDVETVVDAVLRDLDDPSPGGLCDDLPGNY